MRDVNEPGRGLRGETRAALSRILGSLLAEFDRSDAGSEPEVIADVDVEGVRYTLSRRPAEESAPESPRNAPQRGVDSLSSRELEIARMVAKGYTNKTVAAILDISCWTVDTHIRRIFMKLDVRSRSAMVARLAAAHVVAADDDRTPDWQSAWNEHGAAGQPGRSVRSA